MSRARRLATLALLSLPGLAGGCALPAFIHDKTIGPISPAGHVHTATVGGEFEVTAARGIQARSTVAWWFRPYPENFIQRVGRPQTWWFAAKGIQAFFFGLSPLVMREAAQGVPPDPAQIAALEPLETRASEVLTRLGPPNLWIKRRGGSVMAYRADKGELLAFWIGTPPFVDIIPGANNFSFRYLYRRVKPFKTILFFDGEERLLGLADNGARMRGEEVDE